MKRILLLSFVIFTSLTLIQSCGGSGSEGTPTDSSQAKKIQDTVPPVPVFKISWTDTSFDAGHVKFENQPVTHEYRFKNTGNTPISINSVISSSELTHDFTVKPIAPNEEGVIKLSYTTDHPQGFKSNAKISFKEDSTLNRKLYLTGVVAGRK